MTKVNNAGIASLSIKSPDDVTGWLALVSACHATIRVMVVHRHGRGSCKSRAPPPCATQRARLTLGMSRPLEEFVGKGNDAGILSVGLWVINGYVKLRKVVIHSPG